MPFSSFWRTGQCDGRSVSPYELSVPIAVLSDSTCHPSLLLICTLVCIAYRLHHQLYVYPLSTECLIFYFLFVYSASGASVVAIDNKIEQAMVRRNSPVKHECKINTFPRLGHENNAYNPLFDKNM